MSITASASEFDGRYTVHLTAGVLSASAVGKGFLRTLFRAYVSLQLQRLMGPGEGGYAA